MHAGENSAERNSRKDLEGCRVKVSTRFMASSTFGLRRRRTLQPQQSSVCLRETAQHMMPTGSNLIAVHAHAVGLCLHIELQRKQ